MSQEVKLLTYGILTGVSAGHIRLIPEGRASKPLGTVRYHRLGVASDQRQLPVGKRGRHRRHQTGYRGTDADPRY
jgi:hypothetical protein